MATKTGVWRRGAPTAPMHHGGGERDERAGDAFRVLVTGSFYRDPVRASPHAESSKISEEPGNAYGPAAALADVANVPLALTPAQILNHGVRQRRQGSCLWRLRVVHR